MVFSVPVYFLYQFLTVVKISTCLHSAEDFNVFFQRIKILVCHVVGTHRCTACYKNVTAPTVLLLCPFSAIYITYWRPEATINPFLILAI